MRTLRFNQFMLVLAFICSIFNVNAQEPFVQIAPNEWNTTVMMGVDQQSQTFALSDGSIQSIRCEWGNEFDPSDDLIENYSPENFLTTQVANDGRSFTATLTPAIFSACASFAITQFLLKLVVITNPIAGVILEIAVNVAINVAISYWSTASIPIIRNLGILTTPLFLRKERVFSGKTGRKLLTLNLT